MTAPNKSESASATQWYERWQGLVRHVLNGRLRRSADVEDLAHEVYLRLLRVQRPDLVQNPKSYLYRVAVNLAEEWRLRAPQALEHDSEPLDRLASDDDPQMAAQQAERDRAIRRSLTSLPLTCRTAVVLHVQDGMTYEQVARHMGVTRRAVKRYMARGYAALRDELEEFRGDGELPHEQQHGD